MDFTEFRVFKKVPQTYHLPNHFSSAKIASESGPSFLWQRKFAAFIPFVPTPGCDYDMDLQTLPPLLWCCDAPMNPPSCLLQPVTSSWSSTGLTSTTPLSGEGNVFSLPPINHQVLKTDSFDIGCIACIFFMGYDLKNM